MVDAVPAAIGHAEWSTYYAPSPWSAPFVDELALGALVGPHAPTHADGLAWGLFLQAPRTECPPHAHAAAEVYVPVAGEAAFSSGASAPFVRQRPGDAVVHDPDVAHAISTGGSPLLAVFAWRGDVTAPPWNRRDMADTDEPRTYPPLIGA